MPCSCRTVCQQGCSRAGFKVGREFFQEDWTPVDEPPPSPIEQKLAELDPHRHAAVRHLIEWLLTEPEGLIAMARGRHAEGHYRYGDTVMYEYDQRTLDAEAAQELADAINYVALKLLRAS